jgi:hypothetical protein
VVGALPSWAYVVEVAAQLIIFKPQRTQQADGLPDILYGESSVGHQAVQDVVSCPRVTSLPSVEPSVSCSSSLSFISCLVG